MSDLISREEAIRELEEQLTYNDADEGVVVHGTLFWSSDLVKRIIRYNVRSQSDKTKGKGSWVYKHSLGWGKIWFCSNCGEEKVQTGFNKPRDSYCPMCGADMRGDNNET